MLHSQPLDLPPGNLDHWITKEDRQEAILTQNTLSESDVRSVDPLWLDFIQGLGSRRRSTEWAEPAEMAGKGAKATSGKAAEKEKGKKAPASRSSRGGSQVSSIDVLFASYVGYRFGSGCCSDVHFVS
jgi:hypothetical protein